ncbi:hypothetical protein K456DRAFT_1728802 [Colletotrichum gloeosporioides 23]|nr:hypothetical protein K456DRAFT_1728802 [Colletotrichum gloeosporioides 23]
MSLTEADQGRHKEHRKMVRRLGVTMPAINSIVARDAVHQLAKRENWASQEAGVIVVFCIVFIVACGIAGLMISRCISRRKAAKAAA